ncbi:MAG: helix-turn-helix transcriptional regulator [Gemmatimonadales bacterium]|nr:helix-turn-helix transcriptional regulator [Gemmatimonadales bacterium]
MSTLLLQYLKRHGLTQAAFADRAGLSQGLVSRLCRRELTPSLRRAAHIERVTNGEVPMAAWVPRSGGEPDEGEHSANAPSSLHPGAEPVNVPDDAA